MKKLILMLMATIFITAAYAQETKEQKTQRLLNIKEKKTSPVLTRTTRTTTVQESKEAKTKRLLNIKDKKPVVIPTKRTVAVPSTRDNKVVTKKWKKRNMVKNIMTTANTLDGTKMVKTMKEKIMIMETINMVRKNNFY